jgi:hypothetical protein
LIIDYLKISNMPEQKQQKQINIELSEEMAEGIYSNLAMITHSTSEFIIDFGKYESMHGTIKEPTPGEVLPPINFGGPTAQA